VERDYPSAAHVGSCCNTRGIAGNIHARGGRLERDSLAKLGVLPTRLSAVDEAATIDVLCSDKTGTLTRNELSVTGVKPMPGFDEAHVLGMAALASSEGGDDAVDAAIRSASTQKPALDLPRLSTFVPLTPPRKLPKQRQPMQRGA